MTLFIDGGGFCSFWYCLGALKNKQFNYVESVSSGSIAASLYVCMDKIDILHILKVCIKSTDTSYGTDNIVYNILDTLLPLDAHHKANKRLGILIFDPFAFKTRLVSHWETREKLIQCVVASTHIPFVTSWSFVNPVYKCIDGGFLLDTSKYKTVIASPYFSTFEQFAPISPTRAIELFRSGNKNQMN